MRKIKLLPIALAAMLLLGACNSKTAKETTSAESNAETVETTSAETNAESAETNVESAETNAESSGDLGTLEEGASLVYWTMWNEAEPQGAVIAEAAKAFEDKTGVHVEVNFNGRDIRKTLEPALDAGENIDLFDEDVDRVINSWGNYLLPLDEYAAAEYDDTDGKAYRDVVSKALIDLAEQMGEEKGLADGGKLHHIPYQPFIFTMMYNKDLFDKAGITSAPANWEEFLDVCAKLKESGVTPITVDDAYMAALFGYTLDRIVGSDKCREIVENLDFSDPGVLEACQLWEKMAKEGYLSSKAATNVWPAGQVDEFAKNEAAMYLNGTWLPNEIKEQTENFRWGSFAWPAINAAGDGTEANNYGGQSFGINKNTKYPNAAFAFIRFMTIGEYDQKLAEESMGVPMGVTSVWPEQLEEAKAVFEGSSKRLGWAVGMEDNSDVNAAIKDGFAKLVTGEYDGQKFADALADLK